MDEGVQKSSNRLSLPLAGSSNADPKRVSLPCTTVTPVKRCNSPQSKRVVLKELCANTFKKLSINNKVTPSPFKSGSATPSSKPPSASSEKDHETNVQFAREFVEELVEKLPSDGVPVLPSKEDTTRYSIAFSDISAFSESSLPDLLQPEAQYKKQADTDTDTTDYESAVESDALSLNASLGLDRSDPVSSPDIVDAAHSQSTDLTPQVLQAETESFEDAEASFSEGKSTPDLDISALCLDVGKLCLQTPRRPSKDSSGGDSFLITLNSDCQVSSTDTSFNTTECDLPGFVLGESFIDKSLRDSSAESGLLSTTFNAAATVEVSTEYKLEIIRTLDFDLEKPIAPGTEASVQPPTEEPAVCEGTQSSSEVDSVYPIAGPETVDVAATQSKESIDLQATETREAADGKQQIVPAEETAETGHVEQPAVETELLRSSTVKADLESACEELQKSLVVSEVATLPIVNELSAREKESIVTAPEELDKSAPVVEYTTNEILPAPYSELSYTEDSTATQPGVVLNESVSVVENTSIEILPASETELSAETVTSPEVVPNESVPVVENATIKVLPDSETELSCKEDSTVTPPEVVPNESIPVVENTTADVLPAPETGLEPAATDVTESAISVGNKVVPSTELESSDKPEDSNVEHQLSTSVVGPQESTCVVESILSVAVLESSVIPEHKFGDPSSTAEPKVVTSILESISSLIQGSKFENNVDFPFAGTTKNDLIVEPTVKSVEANTLPIAEPQISIVEKTEKNPIVVSVDKANEESAKFDHFQLTEQQALASIALNQRALSPSLIPCDEPELLAVSSEPLKFSPKHSSRQSTISPSFLLIDDKTLNKQVSPVAAISVVTPLPTYQRPSANAKELADVIDPVGACWSPDDETPSCFTTPPHNSNPLSCLVKQEPYAPQVNPIQFKSSPLNTSSRRNSFAPPCDPFIKKGAELEKLEEGDSDHIITKSVKSTKAIEDQSLNDLRAICKRQQRELDNQQFSSDLFGESLYNSLAIANIAAEAAKVSEDIHNASIEQIELEMDENVNPVPLDKKWLSERSAGEAKVDARESSKSRNILGGSGDGFADSLDKQNKNIMTASIDAQTNQSEAGPEIALQDEEETFADSEGFDFLSAKASTGPSDRLVRESLYTKFDPLAVPVPVSAAAPVARHAPVPMPPKFSENEKISPPSSQVIQLAPTPATVPRSSKPTRLSTPPRSVTPCAVEVWTETPTKNSAARELIDRLINLSPAGRNLQASPIKPLPPVVKAPPAPTMEQMSEELVLLRELLSEEEMAYKVSLTALQEKLKSTELELQSMRLKAKTAEEREQKMMARLTEKVAAQKQLAAVMCEYEKTISKLVGEKDNERTTYLKEREALIKEKEVALGHLTNIEIAFSDVHQKYERCKTVVEAFKSNEDVLRESLATYETTIRKQEQKYEMLKAHAMTQLENANQELDAVRRNQATESAKLKAMLKKSELKTSSLEEMLEQKIKENTELASICDDLIAKVGT